MTFVITSPCIDTLDQACVEVCPVDCIHYDEGTDRMDFIDPVECIDCGACIPACPVDAIFVDSEVPADQQPFVEINALWFKDKDAARALVEGGSTEAAPAPAAAPAAAATTDAEEAAPAPAEQEPAAAPSEDAGAEAPSEAAAAEVSAVAPAVTAAAAPAWATPHATKQDYRKAFTGFIFPISKDAVLSVGRDRGGLDGEVIRVLQRLPAHRYDSLEDLQEAVRAVYRFIGVPEEALPL